jgi:hypothetical protein
MSEGLLPPFGEPTGPLLDDAALIAAFARGEARGHSELFHVEDSLLVAAPAIAAAMRIGLDTILVRRDVPPDLEGARHTVEEVLAEEGLTLLDEDTLLATPVAVQRLGVRASNWDLWGRDIDEAFAALRAAAAGDPFGPSIGFGE